MENFSEIHGDMEIERGIQERGKMHDKYIVQLLRAYEISHKLVALQKNYEMQGEWLKEWKRIAESLQQSMKDSRKCSDALGVAMDHLKCIRDFDEDSPWDDPGACAKEALRKIDGVLNAN